MAMGEEKNVKKEEEMRELEEMMSKLNPLAPEFIPSSSSSSAVNSAMSHPFYVDPTISSIFHLPANYLPNQHPPHHYYNNHSLPPKHHLPIQNQNHQERQQQRQKRGGHGGVGPQQQGQRRPSRRTGQAQRDEVIRRTVYVSDIDHLVTEEQLASLFISCGQVVDCRICGDPKSVLRFAFIEFTDEEEARDALRLSGTMLGYYPVKVRPSKTAIAPVNPTFLPQSEDEREMCARTIYITNINRKINQAELKLFFETVCGKVNQLRMLGDQRHPTRIAFVEFVLAECATAALNCSGVVLGGSAIRVSPSKTPVRPRLLR